jgi:hypothetical protein
VPDETTLDPAARAAAINRAATFRPYQVTDDATS